jgi:hypothetical protein
MTKFIDAHLTDDALKTASRITLADLLECPITQCWTISMICNALKSSTKFGGVTEEEDEILAFRLFKINNALDQAERQAAFAQCVHLIAESRGERTSDE